MVINYGLVSDTPMSFRNNLLEIILKLIMTIDDKFRYEVIQYDINKGTAKTSVLPSSKIDKYEL